MTNLIRKEGTTMSIYIGGGLLTIIVIILLALILL